MSKIALYPMKEILYLKVYPSWLIMCFLIFSVACEEAGKIDEIKEIEEEFVQTLPNTFDNSGEVIPNQYLVLLKSEAPLALPTTLKDRQNETREIVTDQHMKALPESEYALLTKYGVRRDDVLEAYDDFAPGFLIKTDEATAKKIAKDPAVESVEQDKVIALSLAPLLKTPFIPSNGGTWTEWTPYGTRRVGGSVDFSQDPDWNKRWAWILDSGIDYDHPDLHVNTRFSMDFSYSGSSYDDRLGHGTHVAGIIGAKNNSVGIQGVAAGAVLVAVKVLDDQGNGSTSTVVNGLRHIYRNALPNDVINISLGGAYSSTIANSINYLSNLGVKLVVAAGNSSQDASTIFPASVNRSNVYTVGAIDWRDSFASYSNYGSSLEFVAPGVGILSTYPGGKYAYMGGTSMAAPHVSGILILRKDSYTTSGQVWGKNRYVPVPKH